MFDSHVAAIDGAGGAGAAGAWAKVESAACARRRSAIADLQEARLAADGSAEREQSADVVAAPPGCLTLLLHSGRADQRPAEF